MNTSKGKSLVGQLVEDFSKNKDSYLSKNFNETETRTRFIDPLFKALGWDFEQTHLPLDDWDVHREYSQQDNSSTKKPDYAFRIRRRLKFFVEAKAPWGSLTDKSPVFQAKRYAYSTAGKAPIVILTDFRAFRVFNAMERPYFDNPLQGVLFDLTYLQYSEKWDFLYEHFSKQAVADGSIDRLANRYLSKHTRNLDDDFLEEITRWREKLAKNIALRNKQFNAEEINEAVQRILDRLIFIRNLEDRDIEPENTLLKIAQYKSETYPALIPLFQRLTREYNGLLFKTHFSEGLNIDDRLIKNVILEMCYPKSPFRFDVIEPEILGHIYERFLGSEIRLTKSHQAKVEEKPEVRKAGGVYYTPEAIVNYIVTHTVGKMIKGMTPEEIESIRISDPACGSGSFLLGAFDYLIQYHAKWYAENKKKKKYRKDFFETPDKTIRVSLAKKGEILRNNIFGVDIDREATEVAMMSLYLKLLDEGFDRGQFQFLRGHLLPDLTGNIKCGNSLIGSDFYEGQVDLAFEEVRRVNAFDWEKEFPDVFKNGGFDVVIGNPPYYNINTLDKKIFHYLEKNYPEIHTGYNDIMYYFIYNGIRFLKPKGIYGVITSNYYLGNSYAKLLRKYLKNHISELINFKDYLVFQDASIHTNIIIACKQPESSAIHFFEKTDNKQINENHMTSDFHTFKLDRSSLQDDWMIADDNNLKLINKVSSNALLLGEISIIEKGSTSGKNNIFTVSYQFAKENLFESELLRKNIKNSDIQRYCLRDSGNYLIYIDNQTDIKRYPNIYNYLNFHKNILSERNEVAKGSYEWYRLERPRKKEVFDAKEKLIVPYRAAYNRFAYDNNRHFNDGGDIRAILLKANIDLNIKYILGILNSKLMNWYYGFIGKPKGKSREYFNKPLAMIPIRPINFEDPTEKSHHDQMVWLVERMLILNKQIVSAKSAQDKTILQRQIDNTDQQIDQLVYKLYDLTPEEIKIAEEHSK